MSIQFLKQTYPLLDEANDDSREIQTSHIILELAA